MIYGEIDKLFLITIHTFTTINLKYIELNKKTLQKGYEALIDNLFI